MARRAMSVERPPEAIRPGDRIIQGGMGIVTCTAVVFLADGRVRYEYAGQPAVTVHRGNWREVFTGWRD